MVGVRYFWSVGVVGGRGGRVWVGVWCLLY